MATRYFVGTGNRNWGDPLNWSSTSGGIGNDLGLGGELVSNGGFDTSSGWSSNSANVYISNGKVNYTSTGGFVNSSITVGNTKMFLLTYTISDYVSGTFNVKIYTNYFNGSTNKSSNGTFSEYIVLNSTTTGSFTNTILLEGIGSCNFKVDDISLKEVLTYPTSADDVIFDNNSGTGTVTVNTVSNMLNLTFNNINNITLANSVYNFNVYGSLILHSNLTVNFTSTGYLYLKATTTGKTITSNGNTSAWNRLYFDGVGGEWTNQDDFNVGATDLYLIAGEFKTNGKTLSARVLNCNVSTINTGKLTLSSSIINLTNFVGGSGNQWRYLILDAGTSTINCSDDFAPVTLRKTFYNVTCKRSSGYMCHIFNNLTLVSTRGTTISIYIDPLLNNGLVVNDTLTIKGFNNSDKRVLIAGYLAGQKHSINAASVIFENVDFRDIQAAGSANWNLSSITGLSGDCGGNTGITFTPAQKQYYRHLGGGTTTFKDATKWFSDATFTTQGRVPLPQDDWDCLAGSFNATTTFQIDCPRIGRSCNLEAVNQSVTMQLMNAIECYGSYVLGNNIIPSGDYNVSLFGASSHFFDIKNKQLYALVVIRGDYTSLYGGSFSNQMLFQGGIFRLGNFDYSTLIFTVRDNPGVGTVYMGSGTLTIKGTTNYSFHKQGNGIIYNSNSTTLLFIPSNSSNNFIVNMAGLSYNKVQFSGSHTGNFDIQGNNTFAELIIDAGRKVRFAAGTTQNINKLTTNGTTLNPITIGSTTTGSTFTLNKTQPLNEKIECDYLILQDSIATPAKTWYAGLNSVNNGNNTGWVFDTFHSRDMIVQPNNKILIDNNGRIVW